jgi:CheY-like chemotaxis protein
MEAVGRLAGGIAHDFNNYLTAIKSYSELLIAEMEEQSAQRADVVEINSAAERAAGLTKQLLAFSRQQMLRPEVMDLNDTISRMQGMLRPLAGRSVKLELHLNATGNVKADCTQVERVIINLIMNARDAMPDGGRILMTTENVELEDRDAASLLSVRVGSYVKLSVSDTGIGMTKEVREKLFEPFFTTKGRGKASGLGLSSVYGIVRQSGGAIDVATEPGKGATFTIYLPREMTDSNIEIAKVKPVKPQGGATIMLVEDDDVVRNVACRVLKRAGFAVLEAENGVAAMELYEAVDYSIDLVLTDVVMPEMNGSELAERIRKVNPQAKILFMSGYTEDKVMRDKLLAPGAAFLEKPFTPDSLTRKAREVLDGPPRGAAA